MEGVRSYPEDWEYIQLAEAITKGNESRVEAILNRGVSVNGCIRIRPITIAVAFQKNEIVKLLIRHGADLNLTMENNPHQVTSCNVYLPFTGETPLHAASYSQDIDVIHILLRAGADPNARTKEGVTPLMPLLSGPPRGPWRDMAQALERAGADMAAVDNEGMSVLDHAAAGGDPDMIKLVHSRSPSSLSNVGSEGETALYYAAKEGHASAVAFLLSVGARHPQSLDHDCCPMGCAGHFGHEAVVRVLLSDGMEAIGGAAYSLPTGLTGAVGGGQVRILHIMLNAEGEEKRAKWARISRFVAGTLLHYAAGYIKPRCVRLLLAAGADETKTDGAGQRAIDVIGTMDVHNPPISPHSPRTPSRFRDSKMEADIRRSLLRGPAFHARSWLWPAATRDGGVGGVEGGGNQLVPSSKRRADQTVLGVRILIRKNKNVFARRIGRRREPNAKLDLLSEFVCRLPECSAGLPCGSHVGKAPQAFARFAQGSVGGAPN